MTKQRPIILRYFFGLMLFAVLAVAGLGIAWKHLSSPIQESAEAEIFMVAPGASLTRIANNLEKAQLIRSAVVMKIIARCTDVEDQMQVGEYELSASMTPKEILSRIVNGKVKTYEITIPEGLNAEEIAERLESAGFVDGESFLAYAMDPDSAEVLGVEGPDLEGYLFPETYRLPHGLTPQAIAAKFVSEFLKVWEEIREDAVREKYTMREVVTLASIVEKETGTPSERPLIASVFRNRLAKHMRLESDPTVIYGIPNFDGNLKRSHLEDKRNAYNTYRISGLPPGAIANPGAGSLRAVVNPAKTHYLYFVSRNDGTHFFSNTYREHVNAVNRYQRRRRSRK